MWNWTVTCCQLITRKSPFQPQVSGVGGVPGVHAACRVVEAFAPEWGSVQGKESAFQEKASNINSATARIAALKPKPLSKLQTLVLITPLLIYGFLAALFWLLLIMYMNCRLVFRSFSKSFLWKMPSEYHCRITDMYAVAWRSPQCGTAHKTVGH